MKNCNYNETSLVWKRIYHGYDKSSGLGTSTFIAKVYGGWMMKEITIYSSQISNSLQFIPDPEYKMENIYDSDSD